MKVEKADIITKNIKMDGYYNINDSVNQSANFSIDSIDIIPFTANLKGEYIKVRNVKITSNTKNRKLCGINKFMILVLLLLIRKW